MVKLGKLIRSAIRKSTPTDMGQFLPDHVSLHSKTATKINSPLKEAEHHINASSDAAGDRVKVLVRIAVVVVATAIYFIRMPGVFINPQFWGEDGGLFFGNHLQMDGSAFCILALDI